VVSGTAAGSGGGAPATNPPTSAAGGAGANTDPASCRGFSFDNLVYSPGGNVLPNTCMPYHPTTNSPYAVRCIDAWPWYKTKFKGDEFCILPPPPDKGIQYGVHPQGKQWFEQVSKKDLSGYDNIPAPFLLKAGGEEQKNYSTGTDNAAQNYYRNYARMRQGSHHMIVSTADASAAQEVWSAGSTAAVLGGVSLPGAQRPDENAPKSLDKPTEDAGLYSKFPAKTGITFNMHHFNASDDTILKEAWTNLWWESDATIEARPIFGLEFSQTSGLSIAPDTTVDLHYSWKITQAMRLIDVFGHRHAWTSNFSSWLEQSDGKLDIIYQSFGWLDEPTYRYDSMTQNPPPSPDARVDGAASGLLTLMPGQKLHFNCHIEYTEERAASEKGAPSPKQNGTLHFANEAFTAEMCILFGSTAGVSLASPSIDKGTLPPFATVD
jgi:hypothetical protein